MGTSVVSVKGSVLSVPALSVSSMIEMSRVVWEESRRDIMRDLHDVDASEQTKLEALRQHREIKDQPVNVIRWALTPPGALAVIERAFGSMPEQLKDEPAESVIRVAMAACGIDWDEMTTEKRAEGKGEQSSETS